MFYFTTSVSLCSPLLMHDFKHHHLKIDPVITGKSMTRYSCILSYRNSKRSGLRQAEYTEIITRKKSTTTN